MLFLVKLNGLRITMIAKYPIWIMLNVEIIIFGKNDSEVISMTTNIILLINNAGRYSLNLLLCLIPL